METRTLLGILLCALLAGCTFEVGKNATLLVEDQNLFDKKAKLVEDVGIEITSGAFHPILPKGTRTPSADAIVFRPGEEKSKALEVSFFAGLSKSVSKNRHLGTYRIEGFLPQTKENGEIQLTLAAEKGKILLEARELETGRVLKIQKVEP
ncbi:Hsp70 family protein [bacterium]|jgi:molecular chaperone DnaK (HSP70)|nr:Hsp70 family protein [bacterium]